MFRRKMKNNVELVGGFKHFLFSISYMGCHPFHWRTHIFQDGYCTTNQGVNIQKGWRIRLWPWCITKNSPQDWRGGRWPSNWCALGVVESSSSRLLPHTSYLLTTHKHTQTDRPDRQTDILTYIHTYIYIYIYIYLIIYICIYIYMCVFNLSIYIYTHKGVNMFVTTTMHVCVRSSQIWWYSTTCNSYPYLPRNGFSEMTVWQRRFGNLLCFLQIYACNNFSMGQWYLSTV